MRTLVISSALIILVVCSARADGDYETRVMAEPGFAQSELDRLYYADPVDTALALAELGAAPCGVPSLPVELNKYARMMATGRNHGEQRVVVKAVISLGYPTTGDHKGTCEKVRASLAMLEKGARRCRASLQPPSYGIRTCF